MKIKNDPKKGKRKFKPAYTNRKEVKLLSESGGHELSKEDHSSLSHDERLQLKEWGLPALVVEQYGTKGVTSLFQWQLDCLANEKVLSGRNLVYSAPTSAGKTLVAEILMLKRVLELGKKAIMILPFVSVAREKMYSLQELFGNIGIRVEGFMGSYNPPGGFAAVDIAICTIEKANSLINKLLEEGSLSQVGTIVVDELHLLGDAHRGYLLELLLTKIKFVTGKQLSTTSTESEMSHNQSDQSEKINIQIIGMSATLPNLSLLAEWLDAELITTNFRPVPLFETIKIGEKIFDQLLKPIRNVTNNQLKLDIVGDRDHIVYLSLQTVLDGHSILIFCPTKACCEKTAEHISKSFFSIGNPRSNKTPEAGAKLRNELNGKRISEVLSALQQCPAGLDDILAKTVAFGVSFHHAGLTFEERDIIESAFKSGVLRVIVATSTLSAGVNLPARRVIVSSPHFNGRPLDVLTYRQMCGRAGRKGIDTEGESILICTNTNYQTGVTLVQSSLPAVTSTLLGDTGSLTSSMKRALLEVVASGVAKSQSEVQDYAQCTLLSLTMDSDKSLNCDLPASQENKNATITECLTFLEKNDFIRLRKHDSPDKDDEYITSQLGSACLASSLSPDEGIVVFKELQKARKCFVLENELHVVYQVTPIYLSDQWKHIDWLQFMNLYEKLSPDERFVADLVGVEEGFIVSAMAGRVSWKNPQQASKLSIHQRFYTALALNDLVNEMSIAEVSKKYEVNKGVVQSLQQSASTFAGMVTAFCSRLGWSNLELLLSQFQERLQFGVQRELVPLVKLSLINGQRARILYNAGIKTMADVAAVDPPQIEQILHRAGSFSSTVHGNATDRTVWMIGKDEAMTEQEASVAIVNEARQYLQIELGLGDNVEFGVANKKNSQKASSSFTSRRLDSSRNSISLTATITDQLEDQDRVFRNQSISKENEIGREEEADDVIILSQSSFDSATAVTPESDPIVINSNHSLVQQEEDSNTCSSDWLGEANKWPKENSEKLSPCSSPNSNAINIENEKDTEHNHDDTVFATNDNSYTIFEDSFPSFDEKDFLGGQRDSPKSSSQVFIFYNKEMMNKSKIQTETKQNTLKTTRVTTRSQIGQRATQSSHSVSGTRDKRQMSTPKRNIKNDNECNINVHNYDMSWNDQQIMAMLMDDAFNLSKNISQHEESKKPKLENVNENSLSAPLFESSQEHQMEVDLIVNQQCENVHSGSTCTPTTEEGNDSEVSVMEISTGAYNELEKKDEKDESTLRSLDYSTVETNSVPLPKVQATENGIPQDELFEDSNSNCSSFSNDVFEKSSDDEEDKQEMSCTRLSLVTSRITRSRSMKNQLGTDDLTTDSDTDSGMDDDDDRESPKLPSLFLHGREISVKFTKVVDDLPTTLFDSQKAIGICFKIVAPPKKTTASTTRGTGIGSRIISKSKVPPSKDRKKQKIYHSMVMCNGNDSIWVFQWKNTEEDKGPTKSKQASKKMIPKIAEVFQKIREANCPIILLDAKEKLKALIKSCGKGIIENLISCTDGITTTRIWDPKIAQWLWQCDESEATENSDDDLWVKTDDLVKKHFGIAENKVLKIRWTKEIKESFMAWAFMDKLQSKLKEANLWHHFIGVEMPCIFPLLLMEMNGFGINSTELNRLKQILQFKAAVLELRAFQLANRQFNINSPKDIRQVLFRELGLTQPPKTRGIGKDVLSKLDHEISKIIIEWRKVSCALHKIVIPFQQECNNQTGRVHGFYSHFTTTGRVVMSEPSIQCIPRDFDLQISFTTSEIEDIKTNGIMKFGPMKLDSLVATIDQGIQLQQEEQQKISSGKSKKDNCILSDSISMRHAFVPCCQEYVILSADYSQLELRILAHLCQDQNLLHALNLDDGDVFKAIAASWKNLSVDEITNEIRQEAKAITYGIIYGMGPKTLSEQMNIDERSATQFIADFMRAYPKIRGFLDQTVKSCKEKGYIETISGRRRYLPHINSKATHIRGQAERQAVNSQIQGSASDLVKKAMVGIQTQLQQVYDMTAFPVDWCHSGKIPNTTTIPNYSHVHLNNRDKYSKNMKVPYFPILNLHDELIFEVNRTELPFISKVIRQVMESALTLTVKLPVVVKTGDSWGSLIPLPKV